MVQYLCDSSFSAHAVRRLRKSHVWCGFIDVQKQTMVTSRNGTLICFVIVVPSCATFQVLTIQKTQDSLVFCHLVFCLEFVLMPKQGFGASSIYDSELSICVLPAGASSGERTGSAKTTGEGREGGDQASSAFPASDYQYVLEQSEHHCSSKHQSRGLTLSVQLGPRGKIIAMHTPLLQPESCARYRILRFKERVPDANFAPHCSYVLLGPRRCTAGTWCASRRWRPWLGRPPWFRMTSLLRIPLTPQAWTRAELPPRSRQYIVAALCAKTSKNGSTR